MSILNAELIEQLNTTTGASQIKTLGEELISNFEYRAGYVLARELKAALSSLSLTPEVEAVYNDLLIRLEFLALNYWPDRTFYQLFSNNLSPVLADVDLLIIERITARLIESHVLDRDSIRQQILRYLRQNQNLLTKNYIDVNGKNVAGTIANWLTDYQGKVSDEAISQIARTRYLAQDKNTKTLSAEEKLKLTRLIEVFEFLKLSSTTPEGYEQDIIFIDRDGKTKIFAHGIISDLLPESNFQRIIKPAGSQADQPAVKITKPMATEIVSAPPRKQLGTTEQEILTAYQGDVAWQQKVLRDQDWLEKKFKADVLALRQELITAVQRKNIVRTIAVLRRSATLNDLPNFIRADEKLNKFLTAVWAKQYGKALADEFRFQPSQPKFVRLFIRYILEQRLDLSTSDAARVGLQLSNILVGLGRKEYNKMAYFDLASRTFKWFAD